MVRFSKKRENPLCYFAKTQVDGNRIKKTSPVVYLF